MPRYGKHPLKFARLEPDIKYRQITISTVVHIPMLAGYWAESLQVLSLFFESLYKSTELPFDLMVFDNDSCSEAQDFLIDQYRKHKIQYLIFSKYNIKKLGAMNYLFSTAPGEYIAFADSDVYFLPGWLESSLKILKTFPEAGQVSAIPTIDKPNRYLGSTYKGISSATSLTIETGNNLIPDQYIEAHRISIGKQKNEYLQNAHLRKDIRIQRDGVLAYVCAQDFQFITRKEVINKVLPLEIRQSDEYYDPIYSPVFEAKIDEIGYWRLSTTEYLVHHMGNHVPDLIGELGELHGAQGVCNETMAITPKKRLPRFMDRLLKSHFIRRILKKINSWSYLLLFEQKIK